MEKPKLVHLVDYLSSSLAENPQTGEFVIITIRPDRDSFRPHNVGILRPQAERLLDDLQRILTATPLLLLLLAAGCSARVEVTTEQAVPLLSAEKSSTVVAVDVLTDPAPEVIPAQHEPPSKQEKTVEVTGCHNTVINVTGDLTSMSTLRSTSTRLRHGSSRPGRP